MASERYPHVNNANRYARDVVSGKIAACRWVKLTCQRHLDDLGREKDADFLYRFDKRSGEDICRFAEMLPHIKGEWADKHEYIVYEPWQCFIWAVVFGWKRKSDGTRRFREVYCEIPRKNSKSTMGAIAGLYMLTVDGEAGAEVYSGATSLKQALEIFRPAWKMAKGADGFMDQFGINLGGTDTNPGNIFCLSTDSRFEPVIAKPGDGSSPSCALIDEYHEHKTPDLYNTMRTGQGARIQPLTIIVTTGGTDTSGPCYDKRIQVTRILEGTIHNEELFGIIYGRDPEDDWTDFETWKKANPNYGISVYHDYLWSQYRDAIQITSLQNVNRCKHLNDWLNASTAWINIDKWTQCKDLEMELADFAGQDCWIAIDLASKIDMVALVLMVKRGTELCMFGKYYLPEAVVWAHGNDHYQRWAKEGYLTVTPGERTDYQFIEDDVLSFNDQFRIREVVFDPKEAGYLITRLQDKLTAPCVEFPQNAAHISEPMKEFEARYMARTLRHDDNPILNWMAQNVTQRLQGKYYMPGKDRAELKIDGIVAAIMALARATVNEDKESIYETRGVICL